MTTHVIDSRALEATETDVALTDLVRYARAAVAAAWAGEADPAGYLRGHLASLGLLPAAGTCSQVVLAVALAAGERIRAAGHPGAEAHAAHAELLGHCRATVAAADRGELAPVQIVQGHLEELGLLPASGSSPACCMAHIVACPCAGGESR